MKRLALFIVAMFPCTYFMGCGNFNASSPQPSGSADKAAAVVESTSEN